MNPDEKECPFCAEIIKEKAKKCKHCGSVLDEQLTQNTQLQQIQVEASKNNNEQIENSFNLANTAAESGNYQEAYNYYNKILEVEPNNYKAWYGKAISAGWQSTLANLRIVETVKGIEIALEKTPDIEKHKIKILAAANLLDLCAAIYKLAFENFQTYMTTDTHGEFLSRMELLVSVLEIASNYNPNDKNILTSIITIMTAYMGIYNSNLTEEKYFLSDYGYDKAKNKILEIEKKIQSLDPAYKADYPVYIKTKSGCFIATSVYGNYDAPEVLILRSFRDKNLSKTIFGKFFIKFYYFISPPIALWLKKQKKVKNYVRLLLDTIIILIRKL